ncbi:MAG: hypothetical protein ACOYOS_18850, partial [Syntrophales bacterium]
VAKPVVPATSATPAAYTPAVPPACTPGMAGAAICDLNARGYESCKSSKSASEFSTCMTSFIAATPRNCTLSSAADKAACESYNKAKFPAAAPAPAPAAPVVKAAATPVSKPVVPAYNPPAARVCTPGMASAAICDLEARANASCRSSKSASEFSTCTANFIATTPRNCALSSKADQLACKTYNKTKFGN